MSEQLPKAHVTLDNLRRAIDAIGPRPEITSNTALPLYDFYTHLSEWERRRGDAWRTAFEWRESLLDRALQGLVSEVSLAHWHDERAEGVRLIREKLS